MLAKFAQVNPEAESHPHSSQAPFVHNTLLKSSDPACEVSGGGDTAMETVQSTTVLSNGGDISALADSQKPTVDLLFSSA